MPSGQHAEERAWLVFRLGPHLLCASALDVQGIIEPVRPRQVPFTPPYVLGWFDFRGQVASVVSLRRKFGVRSGEDSPAGPYVVARVQGDLAAFWVDEVRDVLEGPQADWKPMPPMPGTAVFDRYTIRDAEVILHTTFEGLLRADAAAAFPAPAEAPAKAAPVPTPEPEPAPARTEEAPAPPEPPPPPARPRAATPTPRKPARSEAPRPVPSAPRRPVLRPAEPPPPPRPYQPQDFEVDAAGPEAREEGSARWGWRLGVPAALLVLVAGGALLWQSSVPQAPPRAPATAAGPILRPDPPPVATRIATVKTDAFTLTVERPAKPAPPPAATPNPEPADGRITHVVVRGDTLSHIARQYLGDGARYPELARLSRIRDPDLIHPGDIVTIRQTAPPRP